MIIETQEYLLQKTKQSLAITKGLFIDNLDEKKVNKCNLFIVLKKDGKLVISPVKDVVDNTLTVTPIYLNMNGFPSRSREAVKVIKMFPTTKETITTFNNVNKNNDWDPCEIVEIFKV